MRRVLFVAFLLLLGFSAPVAAVAAPSPGPSGDNTAQVCRSSSKTVDDGLARFVTEMQEVTNLAGRGDLAAAEASVRAAGTVLVNLSGELRKDSVRATAPPVRTVLTELADEFKARGGSLTTLASLQRFDTKRLEQLAERMNALCGGPSPAPSRGSPAPSAS